MPPSPPARHAPPPDPGAGAAARAILLAWSGGKDSTLAFDALAADPAWRIVGLVTSVTAGHERISIHGVRRAILDAQARALRVPVFTAELAPASSNAAYEAAWASAVAAARAAVGPVAHIAYGDLFLADVRAYRERQCEALGIAPVFPLWGGDTATLARRFVRRGWEARLTCVDTTQLDAAFAGRRYDHALLDALPAGVDPCGENGEFHTCVTAGPHFASPIVVTAGERVLRDGRFQYADLVPPRA